MGQPASRDCNKIHLRVFDDQRVRRLSRNVCVGCPFRLSARPSFLSSCLMTTSARIGFPSPLLRPPADPVLFYVMRCRPRDNVSPPW